MKSMIAFGLMVLASSPALAAKKVQSYPAVDYASIPQGSQMAGQAQPIGVPAVTRTTVTISPQQAPQPPSKASTPTSRGGFDPVASDQIESVAQRLKLVEQILRRHSRAYDYRVNTARELRAILARLEGQTLRPVAKPAAQVQQPVEGDLQRIPAPVEDFEDTGEASEEL